MKNLFAFSTSFLLLASCATHNRSASYAYSNSRSAGTESDKMLEQAQTGGAGVSDKKIIYNTSMSIVVHQPDTAAVRVGEIAKKLGGYVQTSGTYYCVIRVPEEKRKSAEDEIALLGKVEQKSTSGEDVTDQYADYEIRLDNAMKSRNRYLELLSKAENVQAALLVEKELERLNETIEMLKGQMNRLEHLSSFATIQVTIKEKKKPGIIGYIGVGIYKAIKWLFVRN